MKKLIKKIDKVLFNGFFKEFYNQINPSHQKKFHKNFITKRKNFLSYESITYWNYLFNHLSKNKVNGDIVECGVGNGLSLSCILFNLITNKNFKHAKYFGFDSFQGFPEPHKKDLNEKNEINKGQWSHTDEKYVLENLLQMGFNEKDLEKITFISGFFDSTFKSDYSDIKEIALLHLDCDLYESTLLSLKKWYPKVQTNGVIVFDEYIDDVNTFPGAAEAVNEFFGSSIKNIKQFQINKKYYLLKI